MALTGWGKRTAVVLFMAWILGCTVPSSAYPPLTAATAQNTLDGWNPNYCKVAEFYGFHQESGGNLQVAYVLIVNPADRSQKPAIYAAQFQLLTRPDGRDRWYLTSLVTHSAGLTRRQGWDNLVIPVQEAPPAGGKTAAGK